MSSSVLEKKKDDKGPPKFAHQESAKDDILTMVQNEEWHHQPLCVFVMGASGDLAKKKTYPALFDLWKARLLPDQFFIYGFARTKHSHEKLRAHIRPYLVKHCCGSRPTSLQLSQVDNFLKLCYYKSGSSYGDWNAMSEILQQINFFNLLVYLAIPPHVFAEGTQALKRALENIQMTGFSRVILEKPFGRDMDSCQAMLDTLKGQQWDESDLYRIDHYLGKEVVQNIVSLRQHNLWLQHIWNKEVVESVHIVFKEPFGTEGRGGYFDPYGIIRDVLQNHLLQILSLIAMDLPEEDVAADKVRDAKVKVLRSMSVVQFDDCLLGQYSGYADDKTIENKDTKTPTYACIRTWVNTAPWYGVPFILEAGKALDERLCEARLNFRGGHSLVFRLQPSPSVFFTANVKKPGFSEHPIPTTIGTDYSKPLPEAYAKLVLEALRGEQANFVRDDELLMAWRIFTPFLYYQETTGFMPALYQKGTTGPDGRDDFLHSTGVRETAVPIACSL